MRFAAALTVTGIIGFIILEVLKLLMEPVIAWVIAMLALALKIALIGLGLAAAIGVGVFFYRRSQKTEAQA